MYIRSNDIDVKMIQYVDEHGKEIKEFDSLSNKQLLEMYEWMIKARVFDDMAMQSQRQGRIGTYAPFKGQEAAQIGSAYALRE